MSLAATRLSLTHLAGTLRDANLGTDDGLGNPLPPDWQPNLTGLSCRGYVARSNGPADEKADPATVYVRQDRWMIVPLGTDILETDQVGDITYRGDTILEGPMGVQAVVAYDDHIEIALRRIR